jgi:hypothetical protein
MRWSLLPVLLLVACTHADDDGGCDTDCPDTDGADTDDTDVEATDLPPWETLAEHLGGALLSVTGTAADDVWVVGAQDDDGPTVLHYDGAAWTRLSAPEGGDLWWGWRVPGTDDELWAVGDHGRALHWTGSAWEGGLIAEGGDVLTLFGVWGAAADDVWAVGGNIDASANASVMFHWDGVAWSPVELPEGAAGVASLYKVWGSGADDVWACGQGGVIVHDDGHGWTDAGSTGTERTLLTVNGTGPDAAWAVGGIGSATILHWDGSAWSDESPEFSQELNGVYARGDTVIGVGVGGMEWRRGTDGTWSQDPRGRSVFYDLHAAWIDPDGGEWAVGGQIAAKPLNNGVLVYAGPDDVPTYVP